MDYWGRCWGSWASELKSTTITQVRKQLEDWWTQCLSFGPQIKFLFAKNAENNVASYYIFWTPYLCLASHSEVCLFHNHLLSKSFVFSPQNFSLLGSLLPGNHFLGCFVFTDDLFFAQISLLAPSGALVFIMGYYIHITQFSKFFKFGAILPIYIHNLDLDLEKYSKDPTESAAIYWLQTQMGWRSLSPTLQPKP